MPTVWYLIMRASFKLSAMLVQVQGFMESKPRMQDVRGALDQGPAPVAIPGWDSLTKAFTAAEEWQHRVRVVSLQARMSAHGQAEIRIRSSSNMNEYLDILPYGLHHALFVSCACSRELCEGQRARASQS